jgi:hypothetical protein
LNKRSHYYINSFALFWLPIVRGAFIKKLLIKNFFAVVINSLL